MNNSNNNYKTTRITILSVAIGISVLSILATILISTSQASAQIADCQPALSLTSNPRSGTVASGSTLPVVLLGELKCGDAVIGGADIVITGIDDNSNNVQTNENGKYSLSVRLSPGVYNIEAYFAGDDTHSSASASKTITVNEGTW